MARWTNRLVLRLLLPLLAAALMLALLARPGLLRPEAPSSPPSPRAHLPLEAERLLELELERMLAEVRARFAAKQKATRDLLEGRATLRQAVRRFREIGSAPLLDGSPTPDEATVCDVVLAHAELLLRDRPEGEATAALATLREQVRDHLAERPGANR
jgi:hypothetical protein